SGNFTGFTSDFVTYGILNTGLGSLSTDILFRPDTSNTFFYKGSLQANSVGLGKVLDREDILGSLTARMDVEGTSTSFKNFRADIEATIESLEFMDYTYRDIEINGLVTEKIWDGAISSATEDLKMDLLGRFDLTGDSPQVDFSLNLLEADLHKLNIDPTDSLSTLSMLLTASFTGNSINNITGDIRILNSRLSRNGDYFDLYDCSLSAYNIDSSNLGLKLRTDYLEADIKGKYDLSSIVPDIKLAGASVFPSLISKQADTYSGKNDFSYEIRFKNTDRVNEFLETGFLLAPGFKLTGQVKPGKNISVTAAGDYAVYKQNSLEELSINCIIADTSMVLDIYSGKLNLLNRLNLEELNINSESNIDDFNININWDNSGKIRNQGAFTAEGKFSIPDSIHTRLDMEVIPAVITINDKNWQVDRSKLTIDSNSVNIDRFMISRGDVFFLVDGKLSENPLDSINIRFNDLNLAGMNKLERTQNAEDSKETEFLLEGMLKGIILLTDVYRNPLFETDILIENFKLNDHEHGDIKILSVWDNTEKEAEISLSNNKDGKNTFSVDGAYDPQRKYLSLMALVDEMPLDILNLFLKSFASDVNGLGSGKVELISDQGKMSLQGSVMAEQASMTIDYLQSTFSFSDSISFHDNKLVFNKIQLSDNKNNKAVINGYVSNSNFKDWYVDLRIDADNILVMDTRQKDNSLFYGTAYASGVITIGGPASKLAFNISAQTQRNTRMFIPLRSGEEISDYTFIRFREDGAEKDKDSPLSLPALNNVSTKTIALNFELVVTPDAEIQLVFDSKLGDVMRARGAGTLNMSLNEDGDFTIFGDYVIDEGEYQLTLGNIFNKRFIVEDGGTISWNGDIMNANVDARAIYKLKASLEDLFQDEAYAARIPVELHLNMSGQLINPVISFDIYLPTADESMRTDLRAA
ncbi:MAG: translocation/assembly module TamB domain-containing protein, partial [Bacteroidales bacterium]|nr:translocation/assembly module TamB domain-containing protein [Bacteroidales bacterium]